MLDSRQGPRRRRGRASKKLLREYRLVTVCEEATTCPKPGECFSHGTATFMAMGEICARCCPFCDVTHGRPEPLRSEGQA